MIYHLSSDAGLLLFKEFLFEIGAVKIISAYFEDDCADELTNGLVMTTILNKDTLASQPTLSRFFNRMDGMRFLKIKTANMPSA